MICPKCKAEYRSGFKVCKDCEVDLVESAEAEQRATEPRDVPASGLDPTGMEASDSEATDLLAPRVVGEDATDAEGESTGAKPGDPNENPFCSFWKGTDLRVCTEVCSVLDEAGIPHKTIRRQDHMFNLNNQSPYEVGVPASLYERAELVIKDAFGTDADGAEDAVYETSEKRLLPNQSEHLTDAGILAPLVSMAKAQAREMAGRRGDHSAESEFGNEDDTDTGLGEDAEPHEIKDFDDVDPADATASVWQGADVDTRGMVEMSLKENDIYSRADEQDGAVEIFVLPKDEESAREIVREIVEGKPAE
jgi:hypothetical protein